MSQTMEDLRFRAQMNLEPVAFGLVLLATLAFTGCTANRMKAAKPNVTVPPSWSSGGEGLLTTSSEDLSKWWQRLGDSTLLSLVEQALKNNPDLRTARSRLREARAQRNLAAANRFPTLTASVSSSGSKTSGSATTNSLSESFDASWEPDVFGAKRKALEAASADARATEAELHNTQVSLVAEVASNYVALRSFQSRVEIARKNEASQSETLQLTEWRAQAGLVSSVDVEQAHTNLEQTRAGIPSLEASVAQTGYQLAILLGHTPGALKQQLAKTEPVPSLPDTVTVGIPADTLRQRPDVRAAEQKIIAETARLRQAETARYPSFSLSGSLGIEQLTNAVASGTSGAATGGTAKVASFSGSVLQTLFDRGRIRAQIAVQNAVQEQAVISYESTVRTALKDVEDALVSLVKSRERLASLNKAAESARNAALLARNRYTAGVADFQTVLDTERTVLTIEDSVAQTQADRASALIQLYKALGGGWSPDATTAVANNQGSHS
ncbi:MAG: efflux transporter outer membrane subunit [Candidatus Acidiferrales bacterium]|jgi:NodT family efflux transporter outer membrane factor (OMF) lipoprotein